MIFVLIDAATPTWAPAHTELGFSYAILNGSYALGCGCLGLGSLILNPFALKFGRQPIYFISTLAQFAISIWSAKLISVADLLLVNVFPCLFEALAEAIVQMTIAQVFLVHQRGMINTVYIWMFNIGESLGPLVAGYITVGVGWRWVWWWNAIFFWGLCCGFSFCYETKWEALSLIEGSSPKSSKLRADPGSRGRGSVAGRSGDGVLEADDTMDPQDMKKTDSFQKVQDIEYGSIHEICTITIDHSIPSFYARHAYQPLLLVFTVPEIF